MLPWLSRAQHLAPGEGGLVRGYVLGLKAMNGVLLPIGLALVLFAEPLVDLLYGPAFRETVLPLQLLGLTSVFYGVQSFAAATFIARDAPGTFARIVGVVVVLNLVGNVFAIPRYGADGAAATAVASGVVLALACLVLARRRIGHVNYLRVFLGPGCGALAMALCTWVAGDSLVVSLPLACLAYVVTFVAVELIAWREDVNVYLEVLPARLRARLVAG
jgi:O-antigen/teichoic acid export membrane protein